MLWDTTGLCIKPRVTSTPNRRLSLPRIEGGTSLGPFSGRLKRGSIFRVSRCMGGAAFDVAELYTTCSLTSSSKNTIVYFEAHYEVV